jgi:tail tube protein
MATAKLWSSVAIAVQSALSAAQTISAITKASPPVVTYVGADPTNGDFIKITAQGMSQVDGRVYRVASVNAGANTLELEGENSTLFDTFTSGTFEIITFGTTLAVVSGLNASGGDFDFIDTTTIHDNVKKQIPGAASPSVFSLDCIWDVADAGLVALKSASDNKAQRAVKITFADSQKTLFVGYIGATLLPTGSAQDKVTTPVQVTMYGKPTHYAT